MLLCGYNFLLSALIFFIFHTFFCEEIIYVGWGWMLGCDHEDHVHNFKYFIPMVSTSKLPSCVHN